MNQRYISLAARSIARCLRCWVNWPRPSIARGQPPAVIPPAAAARAHARRPARRRDSNPAGPYYNVKGIDDHLKMVVNSSRFLTLDKKIPQVQVNNPDVLDVMPISPTQVQISAKRTGVTQVNLWGEDKRSIRSTWSLRAMPRNCRDPPGTVPQDRADDRARQRQLGDHLRLRRSAGRGAEDRGGGQQVFSRRDQQHDRQRRAAGHLHVKVYRSLANEVAEHGLRLGQFSSDGNLVMSGVSGLLTTAAGAPRLRPAGMRRTTPSSSTSAAPTPSTGCSTPCVRTVLPSWTRNRTWWPSAAGRPTCWWAARWLPSHQRPERHNGRLKDYGTRLDFVPIVLGNGRMHIDIRTRVSEPDAANSINGIPALTDPRGRNRRGTAGRTDVGHRRFDRTARSSQQPRSAVDQRNSLLGALFRSVSHSTNEVELLVLVTPEIVDGMQPGQVPACLPGSQTTNPSDLRVFFKGDLEVPNCCPESTACGNCAASGCSQGFSRPLYQGWRGLDHTGKIRKIVPTPNQMAMNPQSPGPGFIGPIGCDS